MLTILTAAFGGTLSSYTWICLVIGFLQLRTPPVLPALHQLPYRMPRPSGGHSEFADNLKKLRGFGNKNKSSEAELLFQFFRFYAHEFDYDKYVLSIRLGKMIPKTDKSWQYAANNKLCVEEPFNTSRNLGNTADEYSFRGLHLELRRAFDLISESKFDEACEQYVFPKEEERVFTRPPNQPRPAMIRSASQTNHGSGRGGGRGGHRGGRHQNNHRGGGGPNRRTSSNIAQDQMYPGTAAMQQDLAWYAPYMAYPQEVLAQLGYLQQESLRQMQMFQSNPMFAQQQQAIGGTQMSGSNSSPGHPNQSSDRSRTNSFDNQPPVNNLYSIYPMAVGSPMFASQAHAAYGAYPTQPNTTPATNGAGQEYRRPSQRSAATTEAASSSALRSQSQPAARSPSTMQPSLSGQHLPISQSFTGTSAVGARSANGVSIPSFMSDDAELDGETQSRPRSPRADDRNTGAVSAAVETEDAAQRQQPTGAGPGSIEFGDLPNAPSSSGATRRRLSTDQTPQTVLDRRMKRTSRSPSPLGHSRAFSAGTGPLASVNGAPRTGSRPVVVNGSSLKTSVSASNRAPPPPPAVESNAPASNGHHHPFYDTDRNGGSQPGTDPFATQPLPATARAPVSEGAPGAYSATDEACFRERVAMLNAQAYANGQFPGQPIPVAANGQPPALQPMPQSMPALPPQNAAVAHLDLAVSRAGLGPSAEADPSVLSPVYENATSPTKPRKAGRQAPQASSGWAGAVKQNLPVDEQMSRSQDMPHRPKNATSPALPPSATNAAPKVSQAREHGHVRGAKSESESGWQRAGKGKKKGLAANNLGGAGTLQGHAEIPPKNTSERKGG